MTLAGYQQRADKKQPKGGVFMVLLVRVRDEEYEWEAVKSPIHIKRIRYFR